MALSLSMSSGPHDAGDDQFAHFRIEPDFLLAFDHHVAVRQHLRDHGGDVGHQLILAVDGAVAVHLRLLLAVRRLARQHGASRTEPPIVLAPMKLVMPESSVVLRLSWV